MDDKKNIQSITIEDPVRDAAFSSRSYQVYDIRLNRIKNLGGDLSLFLKPEFCKLVSQIKFLDGRTSGYSPNELATLETWFIASGPSEMKRHMMEDILRFRYREKRQFENSQLGELFRRLID